MRKNRTGASQDIHRTMGVTFMDSVHGTSRGFGSMDATSFRPGILTSYEALVAGGDMNKELLLRRSKSNVDKIMSDIIREMLQQKLASLHYDAISNYVLFAPTMVVTLLSAIVSIFSTSDMVEDPHMKTKLSISVACLQLFLSILQSLSKQLDYGAKAGFHRSAARTLQKIHDAAKHAEYESRYQSIFKALKENKRLSIGMNVLGDLPDVLRDYDDSDDESGHSKIIQDDKNAAESSPPKRSSTAVSEDNENPDGDEDEKTKKGKGKKDKDQGNIHSDSLGKQYKQAVEQVESFVPIKIANAYNILEARIKVLNESLMTNKMHSLVAWEQVLPALYFQLSETIIEWPGWPLFIPKPSQSVEKTLKDFKESLNVDRNNNADLLMELLDRSTDIFTVNKRLAKKREMKEKGKSTSIVAQKGIGLDHSYGSETDQLITTSGVV